MSRELDYICPRCGMEPMSYRQARSIRLGYATGCEECERIDEAIAAMPTGPWVEGDTPDDPRGWYLCLHTSGMPFLWSGETMNTWRFADPILRHARINVEEG